ncbi:hypothetical protein VEE41_32140 [Escherichia coli]|nr:hypothetical protein VEE41_32140 [Escherichia coli]
MFAGKKSAQIREILISESTWEEMTCLFAPSLVKIVFQVLEIYISIALVNEHSHAPVTLTKLICLRRVFWSVVDV